MPFDIEELLDMFGYSPEEKEHARTEILQHVVEIEESVQQYRARAQRLAKDRKISYSCNN